MPPIRPEEVTSKKTEAIPEVVFDAFNELIVERISDSGWATIYEDEAVDRLTAAGLSRSEIYDKGWLDVEQSYRSAGWLVRYDKPGFNESYRSFFVFRKTQY